MLLLHALVIGFWILRATDRVGEPFEPASHVWQRRLAVTLIGGWEDGGHREWPYTIRHSTSTNSDADNASSWPSVAGRFETAVVVHHREWAGGNRRVRASEIGILTGDYLTLLPAVRQRVPGDLRIDSWLG
ncbi:MAG: hypothetical protein QOI57_2650 [Rubrobacteraceae bacterium]|nr:hypothetical protein [Rubrobacteraceae bacterium]